MLRVEGLETYYGEFKVLHGVSLHVDEGELVAVFGSNGHGKSTLLKTICGLVKPWRGTIAFADLPDISRLPVQQIVEAGLIYVPEERHLFADMTVLDNLRMGAYSKRARHKEDQNLKLVWDLFPRLKERERQRARNLSGGEAQMLAMGRGLMADARFMAIDEPSLGLAPNLVEQIFAAVKKVNDSGIGVLLVEQNIIQVCDLADRIYLIEEGHVVMECEASSALDDTRIKTTMLGS